MLRQIIVMKAYIIITGIVFGLLAVAHVLRVMAEGTYLLTEPIFVLTTIASVGLFAWAIFLFKQLIAK